MNIVHVTPWFPPAWRFGGIVTSVDALARAQVRQGAQVTVLTTDADGEGRVSSAPLEHRDGVRVRTFRVTTPRRLFHAPGLSAALTEELERNDVAHVHGLFHGPGLSAARRARPERLAVSPRGMLVDELIRAKSTWPKRAWLAAFPKERVKLWMASSERERQDLAHFRIPSTHVRVVPNGVEIPTEEKVATPALARVLAGPDYVLFLGRLSWKKGLDTLLDAWLPISDRVRLVVCGPDEEGLAAELASRHAALVTRDRLVLLPQVERFEAHVLLASATCLALFSRHENFGNVVFEALAQGTPVVAHDTVGAGEWVARAGAGWIVPFGGAKKALRTALSDPDELARRGARGPAVARAWSWDAVAKATLEHYAAMRT